MRRVTDDVLDTLHNGLRRQAVALGIADQKGHREEPGAKRVLCFKSELHLSQDGPKLPVRDLWAQLIQETQPRLVITTKPFVASMPSREMAPASLSSALCRPTSSRTICTSPLEFAKAAA